MNRIFRAALATIPFILSVGHLPAAAPGAFHRDWAKYPAIAQIDRQPDLLFALGDIHGDYDRLLDILLRTGLIKTRPAIPADALWTGGSAVLVQTGDMVDKGPHPVMVLRFLSALRESAQQHGGRVIVTMGNHEGEFLAGPNDTKARDFLDDLKRNHIEVKDVLHCQTDIGEFLCTLPFGARVGDWFFSHGGNTWGRTLADLSQNLQAGVDKDGFVTAALQDQNSLLESRPIAGNVWFHPSQENPPAKATEQATLRAYAEALGVHHIVHGHNPSELKFEDGVVRKQGEMFQRWGILFMIDTGLSEGVNYSKGAILRIDKGVRETAVCPGGRETLLRDEVLKQDAGRAAPCTE